MERTPSLSIVVAVKDSGTNIPALLNVLQDDDGAAEIIICTAGSALPIQEEASVALVSRPANALIPELWSAGILQARAPAVALTTGEFIPSRSWLSQLRQADIAGYAGVGGAIDNDARASPINWAIFFLRYSAFAVPLRRGEVDEIAADNAVYDRNAILQHADLLDGGFWEPSFHRRFRAEGRKLTLNPDLVVTHHGTVSFRSFAYQRYSHGRAYGFERASRTGAPRNLALLAASPLVAPVLLVRIIARNLKRPKYRVKLVPAFPWLICFTLAWAAGEAGGYLAALVTKAKKNARPSMKGHG